jgi:3-phenylpropionate/trans-cinnamate dioxygenase ferredoxin subunit
MAQLLRACSTSDIEEEDVRRFDHEGRTYAIYHGPNGDFFATDGYCTREKAHLGDGLVDDYEIECPLHLEPLTIALGNQLARLLVSD